MAGISLPLVLPMSYWIQFSYYMMLMFCFGSMIIVINTSIQVMLQKTIADEYKGRVFSIIETMALIPLGMVIYGILYDIFPGQWVLLLSAACS